jgi:protein-S-isoprenylcysteine O-methyltransferase Ste14
MYNLLLAAVWLLAVGYSQVPTFWLLAHPLAERWRAQRRSPYRVLVPVWLGEMLLVAALTWHWREVALYRTAWAWVPAVPLIASGAWLYRAAHRGFTHEQLIGRAELETGREQRLITSGIRSRVRHPVYLAHLCGLAGWSIGSGLAVSYALLAWTLIGFAIMLPMEDAELERRFGTAYGDYRRQVPRLFPRLSGRRT